MGFEIKYNYYNKIKDSFEYDHTNSHEMKKFYGKWNDDYSLEKLASVIMQQMARRDIFVFDIEIYEFQKKKVSFKQNKSNLIIKNKKFSNNGVFIENCGDENESQETALCHTKECQPEEYDTCNVNTPPPHLANLPQNIHPHQIINNSKPQTERIIRYVMFAPLSIEQRLRFPYKFTPDKKYPVFSESYAKNGIGMIIETIDDINGRLKVSDEHFIPANQNLVGDRESNFSEVNKGFVSDNKLNWNGAINDSVPKLR